MQIHIRLTDEEVDTISQLVEGDSITEKITNYIRSPLVKKEILKTELNKCKTRMEFLKKELEKNVFEDMKNIPAPELKFLQDSSAIIEQNGETFVYGRCEAYNYQFKKKLSPKEFKLLLYETKNGK